MSSATPATFDGQIMPLVARLARMGRRSLELAPGDLRQRQVLLLTVLNERGGMGQQALGQTLDLDPSNLVGLLNELEQRGLTLRRRDPTDRRRHIVELTPDGEVALEEAHAHLAAIEDQLLVALSPRERVALYGLLARVVG